MPYENVCPDSIEKFAIFRKPCKYRAFVIFSVFGTIIAIMAGMQWLTHCQ